MTAFTLERSETNQQPAARCTFQPYISEAGKQMVNVKMSHFYASTGWGGTMGKGDGCMSASHARDYYRHLLEIGFAAT